MKKRCFLHGLAVVALPGSLVAAPPTRLRYGGDSAFPPFEFLDPKGRPQGFQIDVLAELGRAIGVEFDVRLDEWPHTEEAFHDGLVDVVAMVETRQRRDSALFTRGYATPALAIYYRRGQPEPQSLQHLTGMRIALLEGETMRDARSSWLSGVAGPYLWEPDAARALAAVQRNEADAALLPRAFADPLIAAGQTPDVVASRPSLLLQSHALAVAPGREDLLARLQQGLDALEKSGRMETMRVRWLSSHRDVAERAMLERDLVGQRDRMLGIGALSTTAVLALGAGIWHRGRRVATEKQRRLVAERELQRAAELLERSFSRNPEPMLLVDHDDGRVRDANAALLSLLGTPAQAVIGHLLESLDRHVDAAALGLLIESLDNDGLLDAVPLRLNDADGRLRHCLVSAEKIDVDGRVQVFCIVRDITERLEADQALQRGYAELEESLARAQREAEMARKGHTRAETLLSDFTRSVAHDLRAPLQAVVGFTGLLQARLQAGHVQEAITYTGHIARAADRMSAMIAALSSLARVSRQRLERRPIDMQALAQKTWDLLAAAPAWRDTAFSLAPLPAARGDIDLIAQVWQNLLDNAAKYSAKVAAPQVTVDSFDDDRGTWYRVHDNGAGFDPAKAGLLFQPFQRLHSGKDFAGSGIGLSLVRRIVDHHQGEIRLRSAPGQGTVAEFTLDPAGPG